MGLRLFAHPVETAIDALAASAFAAAVAFAASSVLTVHPFLAAVPAFLGASLLLSRVGRGEEGYPLPVFELADPDLADDELLLLANMIVTGEDDSRDELVLDDVLEQLGADPRVVRLFDPRQLPTAGELRASIDRHLRASERHSSAPDASEALSEALAQLRRSLR